MTRIYNSGNQAICSTLSKGLPLALSGSITAFTKGKALTIFSLGSITAFTKGKALTVLGMNFVIQLTTFQALFGIGSSQTNTSIFIKKAELPGLTPITNNSAESLVVGLLLLWTAYAEGKIDGKVSVDR